MAGKKKVLIVDDSPTIRESVRFLIQDEFECLLAKDGKEGFDVAMSALPDAVVADIQMPVVDGLQFLRMLRAEPRTKKIPVVISTTVLAIDKVNECHALGCVGFVLKPVQKEYLLAKLRRVMSGEASKPLEPAKPAK